VLSVITTLGRVIGFLQLSQSCHLQISNRFKPCYPCSTQNNDRVPRRGSLHNWRYVSGPLSGRDSIFPSPLCSRTQFHTLDCQRLTELAYNMRLAMQLGNLTYSGNNPAIFLRRAVSVVAVHKAQKLTRMQKRSGATLMLPTISGIGTNPLPYLIQNLT
jgi:hypothetical protein